MLATLMMDVEDLVTEESDDAALWVAEAFREAGLTASFYVVGEKARLWERRGRQDVIEAFKWHDIGFHSTWHSIHPTASEVCQDRDFLSGMEALWEQQHQGWADAERIFGRPMSCWATTGSSWCPSLSGLMGRMGRAYVYSPIQLAGYQACWFANSLQFHRMIGGFDDTFASDEAFEAKLSETEKAVLHLDDPREPMVGLFLGHPTKIISREFWDAVNFSLGANPPKSEWKRQELKPKTQWPLIKKNFKRLLQSLRSQSHIQFVGTSELARHLDGQTPFLSHEELLRLCSQIAQEERVLFTEDFTAGEILCALCEATQRPSGRYARPWCFGPNALPPVSDVTDFRAEEIRDASSEVLRSVSGTSCLPASVHVTGQPVGLGTFFVALAKAWVGQNCITAPIDLPYPREAEDVAEQVSRSVPGWVIHPRDLKMDMILLHTKLQTWTLKPARPRRG